MQQAPGKPLMKRRSSARSSAVQCLQLCTLRYLMRSRYIFHSYCTCTRKKYPDQKQWCSSHHQSSHIPRNAPGRKLPTYLTRSRTTGSQNGWILILTETFLPPPQFFTITKQYCRDWRCPQKSHLQKMHHRGAENGVELPNQEIPNACV